MNQKGPENKDDKDHGSEGTFFPKLKEMLIDFGSYVRELIDLEKDTKADAHETIGQIERSVVFKGTNLWILIFSVLVCSVGLNINSTAVVIGAMLISPLLGPIMGVGLGVGINSFALIKKSLLNFGEMVSFSVVASAIYFFITPLSEAQSELLLRTSPTIFDAFVALFGGFAGIVAYSRTDKGGTAIPGVAIATALMPPLCTAGYGLATMEFRFFFGALYLFLLNSIFISLATVITVRYLKYPKKVFVDPKREKRVKWYITIFVLLTIIPSIFMAYRVVMQSYFTTNARTFIAENFDFENTRVISSDLEYRPSDTSVIDLTLFGEPLDEDLINLMERRMGNYGLRNTKLVINQRAGPVDGVEDWRAELLTTNLRSDIMEELFERNEERLSRQQEEIRQLQEDLNKYAMLDQMSTEVFREINVQYPFIEGFSLGRMVYHEEERPEKDTLITAIVTIPDEDFDQRETFERWLKVRLGEDNIRFVYFR